MARYGREHKEATWRRILETAGRRLKTDGIDGSGVATLMSDAGLTNGALYTHFASKDDLVATTITDQLRAQREALHAMADDPDAIPAFLGMYLSKAHRDTPADGCPSGAMLADIARSSPVVKDAYTAGVIEVADALAAHLELTDDPEAGGRLAAIALLSCLVGTVQMARSINDPDLSQAVLDQGIATFTAQLTPRPQRAIAAHTACPERTPR